jgi:hypothetical protein
MKISHSYADIVSFSVRESKLEGHNYQDAATKVTLHLLNCINDLLPSDLMKIWLV